MNHLIVQAAVSLFVCSTIREEQDINTASNFSSWAVTETTVKLVMAANNFNLKKKQLFRVQHNMVLIKGSATLRQKLSVKIPINTK